MVIIALSYLRLPTQELTEEEADQFFQVTLPKMCQLALRLPQLVTQAPTLLRARENHSLTLSQLQVSDDTVTGL